MPVLYARKNSLISPSAHNHSRTYTSARLPCSLYTGVYV